MSSEARAPGGAGLAPRAIETVRRAAGAVRSAWRVLRSWRRISLTLGGVLYLSGVLAVGLAAVNTGNNLLFLLLGALLGTLAVSGWLSERAVRDVGIRRILPRGITAGAPARIRYEVTNTRSLLPTLDLTLSEESLPGEAYVLHLPAGESVVVRSENRFLSRGVFPLATLTLSTTFPFGLVRRERDVTLSGEIVVWPRSDRHVDLPVAAGSVGGLVTSSVGRAVAGYRGEYRGLREYRPGDDLRDVHWRKSAATPKPVVREYEPEGGREVVIRLDTSRPPGEAAEEAVEVTASLAATAVARGRPFRLETTGGGLAEGSGPGALEAALDLLARVDFPERR